MKPQDQQKISPPSHPHEHHDPDDDENCLLLKIYPDHIDAYLWRASVNCDVEGFGGSADLDGRFAAWAAEWADADLHKEPIDSDDPRWIEWERKGLALAKEFRVVLPSEYTLWYFGMKLDPIQIDN